MGHGEDAADVNDITGSIIGAALRIHSRLGPGLLESVYARILARELEGLGLGVELQKPVPFEFEGMTFEEGFRADLIVNGCVIVEVKAVAELAPVHARQVLTYLRLLDYRVGLLINFGALHLKDGMKRIVNGPVPSLSPRAPRARQSVDECGVTQRSPTNTPAPPSTHPATTSPG